MKIIKNLFKKISVEIQKMSRRNTVLHYNVMMGLISSLLIGFVELASFFIVSSNKVLDKKYYLYAAILMAVQFIVFWNIYKNDYKIKSKIIEILVTIHPFLILIIGISICYINQGFSNQISSFLVAVFAVAFIQIYNIKKRIVLIFFELIPINIILFFFHGPSVLFFEGLRLTILMSLLTYIYTLIQYQSYQARILTLLQLEEESIVQTSNIEKLKIVYDDLDSSHKITEAMMLITTEILKNEDLDDVLQLVLEEAIKLIPKAQAGSILILSGDFMEYRAAHGYNLKGLQTIVLKPEDLFQAKQEDLYEPVIIKNLLVYNQAHLSAKTLDEFIKNDALVAKSILSCSFKFNGKFFGSINIDNFVSETVFDSRDKYLIKHLAKQLEITIAIHKLYEKAIRPTKYDDLTGAYTRRYHNQLLLKAVEEAKEFKTPLSICTIDINDFKEINDLYGHEIGDNCLTYFVNSIKKTLLEGMIFSRVGGDEFTLVVTKSNYDQTSAFIETIRKYLFDHPFVVEGAKSLVSFGCGIAVYPDDGTKIKELVRLSDSRMYEDKSKVKSPSNTK